MYNKTVSYSKQHFLAILKCQLQKITRTSEINSLHMVSAFSHSEKTLIIYNLLIKYDQNYRYKIEVYSTTTGNSIKHSWKYKSPYYKLAHWFLKKTSSNSQAYATKSHEHILTSQRQLFVLWKDAYQMKRIKAMFPWNTD